MMLTKKPSAPLIEPDVAAVMGVFVGDARALI
jgi:hypothetical protein